MSVIKISDFELPWEKLIGFCLFTLEEELIYDRIINPKSMMSAVFHLIDTSTQARDELKKDGNLTLSNEVFRSDYSIWYNVIFCAMFEPDVNTNDTVKIVEIIKNKIYEHLSDYGAIDKMDPRSQTALIKRLGSLIAERAANTIKNDFYRNRDKILAQKQLSPSIREEPKEVTKTQSPSSIPQPAKPSPTSIPQPIKPSPQKNSSPIKASEETVESLMDFIGLKGERDVAMIKTHKKAELTEQLLEQTKKDSIQRLLSSVIKGLSPKTGVCFVYSDNDGKETLKTITKGMSDKHASFVLGILSKYPEIVKQTLQQEGEKTLDAGDGVVILEETEIGILVAITKEKQEIIEIAKRLTVIKTMINQFLKSSF